MLTLEYDACVPLLELSCSSMGYSSDGLAKGEVILRQYTIG